MVITPQQINKLSDTFAATQRMGKYQVVSIVVHRRCYRVLNVSSERKDRKWLLYSLNAYVIKGLLTTITVCINLLRNRHVIVNCTYSQFTFTASG